LKTIPSSVINNSELEDQILAEIDKLEKKIVKASSQEISERKLIQFKGYVDVKGLLSGTLKKLGNLFVRVFSGKKVNKFADKFLLRGVDDFEKETGIDVLGDKFSKEDIISSEQAKTMKKDLIQYIQDLNTRIVTNSSKAISQGILNGESLSQIVTRVRKVIKKEKNHAKTMVRTEAANLVNKGEFLAAKKSGLRLRKYVDVTLDNRTSKICERMHTKYGSPEKSIPIDKMFRTQDGAWMTPPFHPNCRTNLIYITQEEYKRSKKS